MTERLLRYASNCEHKVCFTSPHLAHSHFFVPVAGTGANAFWTIGTEMVHSEGVLSLTHGFTASMMREFVYSGTRLGAYEFFKDT